MEYLKKLFERETLALIVAMLTPLYNSELLAKEGGLYVLIGVIISAVSMILGRSYVKGQQEVAKAISGKLPPG